MMNKFTFQVRTSNRDKIVAADSTVTIIDFSPQGSEKYLWSNRDFYNLEYSPVVVDLYRLASSVFIADKTILRGKSYDGWTRDISLFLPVSDIGLWEKNNNLITKLLRFLTGDHWQLIFTKDQSSQPLKDRKLVKKGHSLAVKTVCLFSGGLDSFIGAVDIIASNGSIALVSHFDQGYTSNVQKAVFTKIKNHFPSFNPELIQFFIQPKLSKENTTRSRSFLFLSLGILIAASTSVKELIVPENGFISLNVPLTYSRFGSLSTKTTHPNTLRLFNDLLRELSIDVKVVDPYQFKTKGEMLAESKDLDFIKSVGNETMSCAHATAARWEGKSPNIHCGYCLPCLIRRAAFSRNKLDDSKYYTYDVLNSDFLKQESKKTEDLRAVLYSMESHKSIPTINNVLKTGPIYPINQVDDFCKVYDAGIKELESFLINYSE